jgi:long-chain fatty acid transport protein
MVKSRRCKLGAAMMAGALGVAAVPTAHADEFHYVNALVGNRASGMGGAYTAISDDPAGLFYNPAGAVYSPVPNVSASANAFSTRNTVYSSVLGGQLDWERDSSVLLPNFFGVSQPVGPGVFGFSYAVPDSVVEDQDQEFENFPSNIGVDVAKYTINLNQNDNTYNFGPSYAYAVSDSFSFGGTLYVHYRTKELIQNQFVRLVDNRVEWSNSYFEQTEYGLQPIFGVMFSPADRIALGVTASKLLILDSETRGQVSALSTINGSQITFPVVANGDEKRETPFNLRGGIAYFASDTLLLSGDLSYFSKVDDDDFGDRDALLNWAMGLEWYSTPTSAWRLGLFSDYANTPDIGGGSFGAQEHIDLYGASGSYTWFTRNSSISLGGTFLSGSGEAQLFGNSLTQDVDTTGYTIFLATSYSY